MFTILGADGKEYGPVNAGKIMEWIRDGRANLQTKARREGGTEWQALGEFPEFTPTSAAPPAGGAGPAAGVPASAPVTPAGPVDAKAVAAELVARAGTLDITGCIGRGWELYKANFGPLLGVTFVVLLVSAIAGMVPFIGSLASLLLTGVFYGGLYYYYLGLIRGEPREFGDAFAGFTKAFVPLMLTGLVSGLLVVLVCSPAIIPFVMFAVTQSRALLFMGVGMLVLCLIPAIYLGVSWYFGYLLVIDRGLGFWDALEVSRRVITAQWWRFFGLLLLGALIALGGVLLLIIGIIFVLPIIFGAVTYAYEDLCHPPPAQAPAAPASPEQPLRG